MLLIKGDNYEYSKNLVFIVSLLITVVFVFFGVFLNDLLSDLTTEFLKTTISYFGWFYLIATFTFLVFTLYLLLSKYGIYV